MNLKSTTLACLVAIGLSACTTFKADVTSTPLNVNLKSEKIADIQVSQKASAKSGTTVILGIFDFQDDNKFADGVMYNGANAFTLNLFNPIDKAKSAAGYKIIKNTDADVLLSPTYEVIEHNYLLWKNVKVKVDAFPGKISKFKNKEEKKDPKKEPKHNCGCAKATSCCQ